MPRFCRIKSLPRLAAFFILTTLALLASEGPSSAAGAPRLVKDINTYSVPYLTDAKFLANTETLAYFTAVSEGFSRQIWVTDGTAAGTRMLRAITSDRYGVTFYDTQTVFLNGQLYFFLGTQDLGIGLYKTDGTEAGTVLVRDIPERAPNTSPRCLTVAGNNLFFGVIRSNTNGIIEDLWKTDGTAEGTVMVKEDIGCINYQATGLNGCLKAIGNILYFTHKSPTVGEELWRTDGTPEGTRLVKDISPGTASSTPSYFAAIGNTMYFRAYTPSLFWELWKSDGTQAGTALVKDINNQATGNALHQWTGPPGVMNGKLYFPALTNTTGTELWCSDGTEAGTVLVKDIWPASSSLPQDFVTYGSTIFFTAQHPSYGRELWRTDGTEAGTVLHLDSNPGTGTGNWTNYPLRIINGKPYASVYSSSDTRVIVQLAGNTDSQSRFSPLEDLTQAWTLGGKAFFLVNDKPGSYPYKTPYTHIWKVSGSLWQPNEELKLSTDSGANVEFLTPVGSKVVFSADDGDNGNELWASNGTAAGTTRLVNIEYGSASSSPSGFVTVGNTAYFTATRSDFGRELWKTDGTEAGTDIVRDIVPGANGSNIEYKAAVGSTLFFEATTAAEGAELWKTDGTYAGTVLVKDIRPGSAASDPRSLTSYKGSLFFSASDGSNGQELWKSDGTAAGTVMVKDVLSGSGSSFPDWLAVVNDTLYFHADPNQLWKSDGTTGGTVMLKNLAAEGVRDAIVYTPHNNLLFFVADTASHGYELWKSDGTAAGTTLVKDISPGSASSFPSRLLSHGPYLYFVANDGIHGEELWRSDGTPSGTVLVKDVYPGPTSGTGELQRIPDGKICFKGTTPTHGSELWQSDGTEAGTVMVADLFPGIGSSTPSALALLGNNLFFSATGAIGGAELHVYDTTPLPPPPVLTIQPATALTATSISLNTLSAGTTGAAVTATQFAYGLTTSYGSTASVTVSAANGAGDQTLRVDLIALAIATTYHYRLTCTNAGGSSQLTGTFTTLSHQQAWRQTAFPAGSPTAETADMADYDKDGLSNLLEYAFGLDPTRPASSHAQLPSPQRVGNNYRLTFTPPAHLTGSGLTYSAEWSATLLPGSWQPLTNTGTGGAHTFTLPASHPRAFVRWKVVTP